MSFNRIFVCQFLMIVAVSIFVCFVNCSPMPMNIEIKETTTTTTTTNSDDEQKHDHQQHQKQNIIKTTSRVKRQVPFGFASGTLGPIEFPLRGGLGLEAAYLTGMGGYGLGYGLGGEGLTGAIGFDGGMGPAMLGYPQSGVTYPAGRLGRFHEFDPLAQTGFGRPFGGIYAGPFGGVEFSAFGAPLTGPFNHPLFRGDRIMKMFEMNRKVMKSPDQGTMDPNRKTIADLVASGEVPIEDVYPDLFSSTSTTKSSNNKQKNNLQRQPADVPIEQIPTESDYYYYTYF